MRGLTWSLQEARADTAPTPDVELPDPADTEADEAAALKLALQKQKEADENSDNLSDSTASDEEEEEQDHKDGGPDKHRSALHNPQKQQRTRKHKLEEPDTTDIAVEVALQAAEQPPPGGHRQQSVMLQKWRDRAVRVGHSKRLGHEYFFNWVTWETTWVEPDVVRWDRKFRRLVRTLPALDQVSCSVPLLCAKTCLT